MALLDAGLPAARFHIDAVDICTRSIRLQNAPSTAEIRFAQIAGLPGATLHSDGRWLPIGGLGTQQVRFQHGNLFAPGLLAGENAYDFVFCRNVLIYFDRATQERAILVLDKLLSATGFLFVGPAEAGLFVRQTMISAGIPLAFAFRKIQAATPGTLPFGRAPQAVADLAPHHGNSCATEQSSKTATPDGDPDIAQATGRAHAQPRHAACQPGAIGRGGRHLPTTSTANRAFAAAFCLMDWSAMLVAIILKRASTIARHSIWKPNHREALTHLAALLEMQGDAIGARLMNERAKRSQVRNYD